ncbi:MAG: dihydrolipoamide acetyltransferase family protein, partial [bacterium]
MAKVDMVMPQMGESIAEGTIIKWLKKEGEKVEKDEIILEISTDKVDSEIPSPQAGVVSKILASEGETVSVGSVIAHIEAGGEAASAPVEAPRPQSEAPAEAPAREPEPLAFTPEKAPQVEEAKVLSETPILTDVKVTTVPRTDGDGRRFYSPLVRSIAASEGVTTQELETISGTGANGRVTKNDILGYLEQRSERVTTPAQPVQTQVVATPAEFTDDRVEVIPMDNMRKSIAAHMVNSVQTSPHVFAVSEADMSELVRYREVHKNEFLRKEGFKLTYMPFIIHACAQALRDFPMVNSSVQEDKIIRKKYINVGVAVALPNNGLIVPVIKGADGMNILGLARVGNDLAQRARTKKLRPDEV